MIADKYKVKPEEIKTHAEWALIDGYGFAPGQTCERWDWLHEKEKIAGKTSWYRQHLQTKEEHKNFPKDKV